MSFIVSTSPHLRSKVDTTSIMRDVVIALVPALIAAVVFFGFRALLVTVVCVAAAVLTEYIYQKSNKLPVTIGDWSAVVTGVLLAYNLPVSIPLWQGALGSVIAILVVKQLFGGLGRNFANPAIVGRIILFLSFSGTMTKWTFPDGISTATPLAVMKAGGVATLSKMDLFLGNIGGCLGEVSALALIIGFIYLLIRRVISWHTPVAYVATVFVFSLILGGSFDYAVCQILSGGLMLGAIFMATDYATTPSTRSGQLIFGLGAGLLTILIRQWGAYAEGVSFAILFMNILTPYISKWTRSKPLGGAKA